MPPVTDTWRWLRLPTAYIADGTADLMLAVLEGYARTRWRDGAGHGLQFLCARVNQWHDMGPRLCELAWSLTSLELHRPIPVKPLLLVDEARQPLLPQLRHLRIGRCAHVH